MRHILAAWVAGLLVWLVGAAALVVQEHHVAREAACGYGCYQPTGLKFALQDVSGRHTVYVIR